MRSRRRILRVLAVVAAIGLVTAACGGEEAEEGGGGAKETVKIAFIGAISGDYSFLEIHAFQSAKLAFQQANAGKYGDLPVRIELLPMDTQGSADQAVPLADKVVADSSVVGVIGPAFSGESLAVNDRLDQAGITHITQSATNDALSQHGWAHWFRGVGNNSQQAIPGVHYAAKVLGANCVFVASDGTAGPKDMADQGVKELDRLGVSHPRQEAIDPNAEDFSALVTKVKDSGCSVLYYTGFSAQSGLIRKQLNDAGLSDVTLMSGDGSFDEAYPATAGAAGEGTVVTCPCADVSSSTEGAAQQYVADYSAEYGTNPGVYGPEAWDIAQVFIAAIKAGNTTREEIYQFVRGLQGFEGVTKTYTWQDNGELDPNSVTIYFYKLVGGKWEVLGTSTELLP